MKVIGVGASAGGLQAMRTFLANLPKNTGACYVLIQHLSPDSKSVMGELLSRETDMPVHVVYEDMPVQANHIYVMSESKDLTFNHDMLIAKERDTSQKLHLPIDQFFNALAENLGPEAIGIVLSGSGTDGTRGVRAIKEQDGIVLVQDQKSATFDGMPQSAINLNIADAVLPPDQLAEAIVNLLNGRAATEGQQTLVDPEEQRAEIRDILSFLSDQTGVDFHGYRKPTLVRRMENRMLLQNCSSVAEYGRFLEHNPAEVRTLFHSVLIGVTRFFRDPMAFEDLRKNILPKIFSDPAGREGPYRFWIPACSTGEEAYSIAMLVDEYIKKNQLEVDYKIFASDIDEEAIRFAINGIYANSMVVDTPKKLINEYFENEGMEYRVKAFLRKKVLFAVQDLIGDPPFINMDLISCRNLLIYLEPTTQQTILSTLHFALRDSGILMLGPSESLGELKYAFRQITRQWNIFEKESDSPIYKGSRFKIKKSKPTFRVKSPYQNAAPMTYDETGSDPFTLYLVERFAPISLFVNQELDLLYINGDADRLLNMPKALARLNLRKMLGQEEFMAMKTGVQQAMDTDEPVVYQNVLLRKDKDQQYTARLRFSTPDLFHGAAEFRDQRFVLIEIHLQENTHQDDQEQGTDNEANADYKEAKQATLQKELRDAKRRSNELVDELESTNEELQTSNRELMASNEELQSTNEELQSVNEELYTVNSELQLKNEELSIAHNDINNLLKSTEIGTIFLDKSLRIRKFTPAVRRQFELLDSDLGRTITSFSNTFQNLDIERECQKVFETLEGYEKEVIDKTEDHYLMRILPYRTEGDNIDGIVLTFIDINELVQTRYRMEKLAKKYRAIFNYSYSVIAVLDQEGKVESMNRPLGSYKPKDIIGSTLFETLPEHINHELRSAFKWALEEETPSKVRLQLGQLNWFDISFIPNPYPEEEEKSSIILMGEEVSEHQRRISTLQRSIEEYKGFMDNAPQQIALVNRNGLFHYVNYSHFTGLEKEAIVGRKIYDFLEEGDTSTVERVLQGIFEENKPVVRYGIDIKNKDGKTTSSKLIATPVIIDGKIEFAAIMQEINDNKEEE